jgi:hypothetical protein
MQRSEAETLGLKGLTWLAGEPDALLRFLAVSGLELDDLKARAGDPELLAAILDFLLAEDALLMSFCNAEALDPKRIHQARALLPGGMHEG